MPRPPLTRRYFYALVQGKTETISAPLDFNERQNEVRRLRALGYSVRAFEDLKRAELIKQIERDTRKKRKDEKKIAEDATLPGFEAAKAFK